MPSTILRNNPEYDLKIKAIHGDGVWVKWRSDVSDTSNTNPSRASSQPGGVGRQHPHIYCYVLNIAIVFYPDKTRTKSGLKIPIFA